ncbi:MAG TPA: protein kinase [Trebonia sp.]|jgi:serine/threonine-protein kinase|nr:protein kinase [Trebonia sp.]
MVDMPLVGEEFAGYRLVSVLGKGGMSIVFRAENPRLGNVIALKVLDPSLATDDVFRTRFLEESRIAASMNHPNVIPIHDMGSSGALLYIAMRCVTGTDLRQMLKKRGRLPPETAVFLLSQAARALDAAHRRGLVHRDVKPGNLLVERGNDGADPDHVYLADFGITKHVGGGRTGLTSRGEFLGTIDYVAPEQIRGISVLGLADQYALGCVLYECLTGRVPFEKDLDAAIIWAHVEESPTQPTRLRPELPPAIDAVFARALAKNPGDRYETCRDFMNAAREALGPMAEPMTASDTLQGVLPGTGTGTAFGRPGGGAPGSGVPGGGVPASGAGPGMPGSGAVAGLDWSAAAPYQGGPSAPAPDGYPGYPGEVAHESGDAYRSEAPTASWPVSTPVPQAPSSPSGWSSGAGGADGPTAWSSGVGSADGPGGAGTGGSGGGRGASRGPGRRAARRRGRRLGWLVAALALLLVAGASAAVTLGLTGGKGTPQTGGTESLAAGTGTNSASTSITAAPAGSSGPGVAVPTVAGKIAVGQNPSYIQVAPNGKFAYIANPGAGAVNVLNTVTDRVSGTIQIPQGPPQFVSFSPDSRTAYVSVYNTRGSVHLIAFVDTASGSVTGTVPVNNFTPGPSTPSPDGRFLYVPNHNTAMSGANENVVDVIDTSARKLVDGIAVPANPHWVAFDKNGRFYTSDHMSAKVTVVNASTNAIVAEIEVGETPHSEAMSPDGSRLAVTSFDGNEVFLIDTATDKMVATIPVGRNPLDVAYSRDGRELFTSNNEDNTVTVIDTADNHVIGTVPTGKNPTSISVLPNGHQAYITDDGDGTIEILNITKAGVTPAGTTPANTGSPATSPSPAASASMSSMPGM